MSVRRAFISNKSPARCARVRDKGTPNHTEKNGTHRAEKPNTTTPIGGTEWNCLLQGGPCLERERARAHADKDRYTPTQTPKCRTVAKI